MGIEGNHGSFTDNPGFILTTQFKVILLFEITFLIKINEVVRIAL